MANYVNPESFITGTGWKPDGPLAGAIEGMRTNIGLEQLGRMNRDSDLANEASLFDLGVKRKNEETYGDMEREDKLRQAQARIEEITSGRKKKKSELDIAESEQKLEDAKRKAQMDKFRMELDRRDAQGSLAEEFVLGNPNGPAANPFGFDSLKRSLKEAGIEPLDEDPAKAWDQLQKIAHQYQSNKGRLAEARKHLQQMEIENTRAQSRVDTAEVRATAPSNRPHNPGQQYVADLNALQAAGKITLEDKIEALSAFNNGSAISNALGRKFQQLGITVPQGAAPPPRTVPEIVRGQQPTQSGQPAQAPTKETPKPLTEEAKIIESSPKYAGEWKVTQPAKSGIYKDRKGRYKYWDAEKKTWSDVWNKT